KHLAIEQPTHRHEYGKFEGVISGGYGAGTVKQQDAGKVLITHSSPDAVHFTTAHKRFPERFVLKHTGDKQWLLMNTTPTKAIPYTKTHYTHIPKEKAEEILSKIEPGSSVQAKIDGA